MTFHAKFSFNLQKIQILKIIQNQNKISFLLSDLLKVLTNCIFGLTRNKDFLIFRDLQ